jgi:hypothetical protein
LLDLQTVASTSAASLSLDRLIFHEMLTEEIPGRFEGTAYRFIIRDAMVFVASASAFFSALNWRPAVVPVLIITF